MRGDPRGVEEKTAASGQTDLLRASADKVRNGSEIPLGRWELAEMVLVREKILDVEQFRPRCLIVMPCGCQIAYILARSGPKEVCLRGQR